MPFGQEGAASSCLAFPGDQELTSGRVRSLQLYTLDSVRTRARLRVPRLTGAIQMPILLPATAYWFKSRTWLGSDGVR